MFFQTDPSMQTSAPHQRITEKLRVGYIEHFGKYMVVYCQIKRGRQTVRWNRSSNTQFAHEWKYALEHLKEVEHTTMKMDAEGQPGN